MLSRTAFLDRSIIDNRSIGMERLTVLMTVYNGSRYLHRALGSLLSQTFKDFELVVVDDGSTDSSVSIVESYLQKLNIKIFKNPKNLGITKSIGIGIANAKTSRIVMLDQDDVCLPNRLNAFYHAFSCGAKLITSSYSLIDDNDNLLGKVITPPRTLNSQNCYYELIKRNHFLGSALGFDATAFSFLKITSNSGMATDYDISLEISKTKQSTYLFEESLLLYRIHPKNTSKNYNTRNQDAKNVLIKHLDADLLQTVISSESFEQLLALLVGYQFIGNLSLSGNLLEFIRRKGFTDQIISNQLKSEYLFYSMYQSYCEERYEDALQLLASIETMCKPHPVLVNNHGCILWHLKRKVEAAKKFRVALDISPNYRDAKGNVVISRDSTGSPSFTARYPRTVFY